MRGGIRLLDAANPERVVESRVPRTVFRSFKAEVHGQQYTGSDMNSQEESVRTKSVLV